MSICSVCGREFESDRFHPHQKYCSKVCRTKPVNARRKEAKSLWAQSNKDKVRASQQKWIENNPDKRKSASSNYMKRNRPYYTEYSSLRCRHMKCAKPNWLSEWDEFYIEELYDIANRRKLEVDHIIPIKHKLVCGLHVPHNLQLLTRSENAKKNNSFKIMDEDIVAVLTQETV